MTDDVLSSILKRISVLEAKISAISYSDAPISLDDWLMTTIHVNKFGPNSLGILLTRELKSEGYNEGDEVVVMLLRKGHEPFAKKEAD